MFRLARAQWSVRLALVLAAASFCYGAMPAYSQAAERDTIATLETTQAGFRQVQQKVGPAVVTIFSTAQVRPSSAESNDPFDSLFGAPQRTQTRRVSGSGVIIRPEGIVLTNSHVVADATKVTVQLAGSDKRLPAEVVQTDPRTDLAIVRITEKGTYTTAKLAATANVQTGDWAIAFGSPYGLPSTMTVGVISATGRKLQDPESDYNFYDLIQTDASINHGNSGGPLVNIRGEVIGINFMIFSPGEDSGSVGIGFAIPVNDYTKRVIDTLIKGETVKRGLLGIEIGNLDDAMRQQFGVTDGGIIVQNVRPGMSGDKAGLQDEDIIVEFNGTKVTDSDQFVNLVQRSTPGTQVSMVIIREKKRQQITITVGTDTATNTAAAGQAATVNQESAGLTVTTLTPNIVRQYGLTVTSGVIVTAIKPGSPAEDAGLQPGNIITRVGSEQVTTADEFWMVLSKTMVASKVGVVLRVRSGDRSLTLTMPQIDAEK